jgi:hypothetical protein
VRNNQLGTYAEYLFATECIKRGYSVSFPLMDSSPYDCIVDTGVSLLKIQIKASEKRPYDRKNSVCVPLQNAKSIYTKDVVDYFALFSSFYGGFFIFPNKGNMQSIRLSLIGKNKKYFNNFVFDCETLVL